MNMIPTLNPISAPCNNSFDLDDWEILAQYWYPVARVQDVSSTPQQVTLLDLKMALYQTLGRSSRAPRCHAVR